MKIFCFICFCCVSICSSFAQGVVTLATSAGPVTVQLSDLPPPPRTLPVVIEGKDGQQCVLNPGGTVTDVPSGGLPPKYAYSDDKLDASDSLRVDFTEAGINNYGYDTKKQFKWSKNYEIILLKNNRNYFVPYQSVATNAIDGTIIANVMFKNSLAKPAVAATDSTLAIVAVPAITYDISKVTFKLENGTTVLPKTALTPATTGYHTTFKVDISAIDVGTRSIKETFIYAYYETKKIGKINITALKKKEEKIILVPVAGAVLPSASAIQTYLNGIYKGANVVFTVETKANFTFDLSTNGTAGLERSDENVFGKYSLEMRALKSAYMAFDANYDKKANYIFVVPSFSGTGDLKGFMVRGRSVGFITSDADNRTIAHELGHGVFGLEHTFPEIEKGKTNNLMDYVSPTNTASNTHLTHEQWKIMHARKPAYSWFDSEEDGSYETDGHYSTVYLVSLMLGMDKQLAKELAVATEDPDTDVHSDTDLVLDDTWLYPGAQKNLHALTGGFHGVEEFVTAMTFLNAPKANKKALGELLHRFGDTYAHSKLDNLLPHNVTEPVTTYNLADHPENINMAINSWALFLPRRELAKDIEPWIRRINIHIKQNPNFLNDKTAQRNVFGGKTMEEYIKIIYSEKPGDNFRMYGRGFWTTDHFSSDGGSPDMIYVRPQWYLNYVRNLAWLLSKKYELKDMSFLDDNLFQKMARFADNNKCSLKGIIDYEIAIKLNKNEFYIPILQAHEDRVGTLVDALLAKYQDLAVKILGNTKKYLDSDGVKYKVTEIRGKITIKSHMPISGLPRITEFENVLKAYRIEILK